MRAMLPPPGGAMFQALANIKGRPSDVLGTSAAAEISKLAGAPNALDAIGELGRIPKSTLDSIMGGPAANAARALQDIANRSGSEALRLHDYASALREPVTLPPMGPRLEAEAAWTIQEELPVLVEIQAKMSEQISDQATIAQAGLEESKRLRETLDRYTDEAGKSSHWLNRLTIAIVALTAVLAVIACAALYLQIADSLRWWPFLGV
jgi:hypothetical protein